MHPGHLDRGAVLNPEKPCLARRFHRSCANGLLHQYDACVGTLNSSHVRIAGIFREGVRWGAAPMIVAHNHPSGDPTPSPEDVEVTRLQKGCRKY